jgi:hypothetical protein
MSLRCFRTLGRSRPWHEARTIGETALSAVFATLEQQHGLLGDLPLLGDGCVRGGCSLPLDAHPPATPGCLAHEPRAHGRGNSSVAEREPRGDEPQPLQAPPVVFRGLGAATLGFFAAPPFPGSRFAGP